jgi:hypothetical protein
MKQLIETELLLARDRNLIAALLSIIPGLAVAGADPVLGRRHLWRLLRGGPAQAHPEAGVTLVAWEYGESNANDGRTGLLVRRIATA